MQMTDEEAQKLFSSDFGNRLLRAACEYAIPIFWSILKDEKWVVENNGTAFILNCGKGPFLVTAAHIYESYCDRLSDSIEIWPQLSDITFRMEERLIGYLGSKTLDIVTFKISSEEIKLINRRILEGSRTPWTAPIALKNEGALFAGFPGLQRTDESENECGFGFFASLNPISSVSERHFGCAFDRSKWVDAFGKGFPKDGYNLGGISGAPVLIVEESEAGIWSWRLGGVVYNASNVLGEIILAHHAKFISEDGNLNSPNY
jgi:hypothetical protein